MQDRKTWSTVGKGAERSTVGKGFTLLGVIYAVILLGILATVAASLLNVSKFRMNSAAEEVATELMSAQRNAVLKGHDVVVAIDQDSRWLRVHLDANNDGIIQGGETTMVAHLAEGVVFGRAGGSTLTPSSQTVTFTQFQGSLKALTFHRDGSASEAGVIYLTSENADRPSDDRAIEVVRSTAKVKCRDHGTGNWREAC